MKLYFGIVHLILVWNKKESTFTKNLQYQALTEYEVTYLTCYIYNLQVHDMF